MVIIITLAGQGLALLWLIRVIKPDFISTEKPDEQQTMEIEFQLYNSALKKFRAQYPSDIIDDDVIRLIENRLDLEEERLEEESE